MSGGAGVDVDVDAVGGAEDGLDGLPRMPRVIPMPRRTTAAAPPRISVDVGTRGLADARSALSVGAFVVAPPGIGAVGSAGAGSRAYSAGDAGSVVSGVDAADGWARRGSSAAHASRAEGKRASIARV